VHGEHIELVEAALVHEKSDTLARGQLAATVLCFGCARFMLDEHTRLPAAQIEQPRIDRVPGSFRPSDPIAVVRRSIQRGGS